LLKEGKKFESFSLGFSLILSEPERQALKAKVESNEKTKLESSISSISDFT
jgi:hypothetical protein